MCCHSGLLWIRNSLCYTVCGIQHWNQKQNNNNLVWPLNSWDWLMWAPWVAREHFGPSCGQRKSPHRIKRPVFANPWLSCTHGPLHDCNTFSIALYTTDPLPRRGIKSRCQLRKLSTASYFRKSSSRDLCLVGFREHLPRLMSFTSWNFHSCDRRLYVFA